MPNGKGICLARWIPQIHVRSSLSRRRLEVVGTRKNGRARRRHASRVSLARGRSLFRPLLPSARYAGYVRSDHRPLPDKQLDILWRG